MGVKSEEDEVKSAARRTLSENDQVKSENVEVTKPER